MANKRWLAVMLMAAAAAPVVQAQVVDAVPEPTAHHYLDEMAVMDAKIAYLRKESELRSALAQRSQRESLPKVISIVGDKRGRSAQVVFTSGVMRWLRAGDQLADGLRVVSVARSVVMVGDGRDQFALSFVSSEKSGAGAAPPPGALINTDMPDVYIPRPGLGQP